MSRLASSQYQVNTISRYQSAASQQQALLLLSVVPDVWLVTSTMQLTTVVATTMLPMMARAIRCWADQQQP